MYTYQRAREDALQMLSMERRQWSTGAVPAKPNTMQRVQTCRPCKVPGTLRLKLQKEVPGSVPCALETTSRRSALWVGGCEGRPAPLDNVSQLLEGH